MSTATDTAAIVAVQPGHVLTRAQAQAINRMAKDLMAAQGCLMAASLMIELGLPVGTETMKTTAMGAVSAYDGWASSLKG